MSEDPVEGRVDTPITVSLRVDGDFETGHNAITISGADLDWGDGTHDVLPVDFHLNAVRTHTYNQSAVFYPSARLTADFKYDGKGSCSYTCDLRRAGVAVIYPEKKPPYLHKVLKGESLATIAHDYGLRSWQEIYIANNSSLASPNMVEAGQTILVPEAKVQSEAHEADSPTDWSAVPEKILKWVLGIGNLAKGTLHSVDEELENSGKTTASEEMGQILIDTQLDKQIEGQLEGVKEQVKEKLDAGAPGVAVTVRVNSAGDTKSADVYISGEGETPLIAVGNYLGQDSISAQPAGAMNEDESYVAFFKMENGQMVQKNVMKGALVSGDAQAIRAMAKKQKEDLQRSKEIAAQMKQAKDKADAESALQKFSNEAKTTAATRQTLDEGPGGQPRSSPSGQASGTGGHTDRPGMDHGHTGIDSGSSLPSGGNGSGGNGNGAGGGGGQGIGKGPGKEIVFKDGEGSTVTSDSGRGGMPPESNLVGSGAENFLSPVPSSPSSNVKSTTSVPPGTSPRSAAIHSPKSQQDSSFWGMPQSRTWVDVNNDGLDDFCRIVKMTNTNYVLRCTLSQGKALDKMYAGGSFETPIASKETGTRGAWVDVIGDGSIAYCRSIAMSKGKGVLACTPVRGDSFGNDIRTDAPVAVGLPSGREWIDIDGDGKTDFCTAIELRRGYGSLSCVLSNGTGFATDAIRSAPMHWRGPGFRGWLVDRLGKANFCTVAGANDEFVDCTTFANGRFGETHRDLLSHTQRH